MRCFSVHPPTPHTSVTYLCGKTGCCSCLLGTQDVIQAARYLVIRNWQPLSCHSSRRLRLNETCQAKQASVTNKQSSSFFFFFWSYEMRTTDKFFIKKLPDHMEISTHSHCVHACTCSCTHRQTCSTMYSQSLPMPKWLQKEQRDKKKWIADTSSLPCPFKLNYTC